MNLILTDHTTQYTNFKHFASSADKLSDSEADPPAKRDIDILSPRRMILYLKSCMTAMPIFHANDYKTTAGKMLPAERQGFEPLTETINIHGTTHEKISARFEWEQPHLNSIPYQAFDTSYRIYRKVYKDCTVYFENNRSVLPHPWSANK